MTSSARRPILFLDVDGPLIPFGAPPGPTSPKQRMCRAKEPEQGNPLLERLDPAVGPRLLALGCDLVWASTWLDEANEIVAPRLGLPKSPVVRWPDSPAPRLPRGVHWKTPHLVEWARHRPFVWVDDESSAMDRLWVAAQHPGPFLLHRVDPKKGLITDDFATLTAWLSTQPANASPRPGRGQKRVD